VDVGRLVVADDAARVFPGDLGGWGQRAGLDRFGLVVPAVVEHLARVALEAVRMAGGGAAALDGVDRNALGAHGHCIFIQFPATRATLP
jgi:hypothetical protein